MALVSITIPTGKPMVIDGKVRTPGTTITMATATPMEKIDINAVVAIDTGGDWLTPNEA